jgi:hypothetical protein
MRRWVCIVALLAGFTGQDYVWSARLRHPVAVERLIGRGSFAQTGAWWSRPGG